MKSLRHVRLCVTPWTVAYQVPLSIGFSRQEYWSGVPSPSPTPHQEAGRTHLPPKNLPQNLRNGYSLGGPILTNCPLCRAFQKVCWSLSMGGKEFCKHLQSCPWGLRLLDTGRVAWGKQGGHSGGENSGGTPILSPPPITWRSRAFVIQTPLQSYWVGQKIHSFSVTDYRWLERTFWPTQYFLFPLLTLILHFHRSVSTMTPLLPIRDYAVPIQTGEEHACIFGQAPCPDHDPIPPAQPAWGPKNSEKLSPFLRLSPSPYFFHSSPQ